MKSNFKSLIQVLDYFKEEKTCYQFLELQIWENGKAVCPHCGSTKVYTTKSRSSNPAKKDIPEYRCANKECTRKFTSTVGTIFESSKIPLRTWYGAIYLISSSKKGVSSLQLARQLQVTQKTAWYLLHRIREMFKESAPAMLKGIVAVDETFIGGKARNRKKHKRGKLKDHGRSMEFKTPVLGAIEKNGKVKAYVVADTTIPSIIPIIRNMVEKGSVMVSDEWRAYAVLKDEYQHEVIQHRLEEYVRDGFTTNSIEGFWAILKRGIYGIYHNVSPKHLQRYVSEFEYRYNNRQNASVENFEQAVRKAANLHLPYTTLTK